jgi:Tol biopolymer transport system component
LPLVPRLRVLAVAALAVAVLLPAVAQTGTRAAPSSQRIVFDSGWNGHLRSVDGAGHDLRRVTSVTKAHMEMWPSVSPDGRRIVFESCLSAGSTPCDVFLSDINGHAIRRLTTAPNFDGEPAWSPDGKRISFTSNRASKNGDGDWRSELYVVNADGSGETRLTNLVPTGWSANHSTWSPDGKQILFMVRRFGGDGVSGCAPGETDSSDLWVIDADGSGAHPVVANDHVCAMLPDWSPDGKKIIWIATDTPSINGSRVMMANADGSGAHVLVGASFGAQDAVFSPDGSTVAFSTGAGVWTLPAAGGKPHLLNASAVAQNLSWGPATPAGVLTPHCAKGRKSTKARPCYRG